jgi:hypothetical protein
MVVSLRVVMPVQPQYHPRRGDVVLTGEGYVGLVLATRPSIVTVRLGNGVVMDMTTPEIAPLVMPGSSAVQSFLEDMMPDKLGLL